MRATNKSNQPTYFKHQSTASANNWLFHPSTLYRVFHITQESIKRRDKPPSSPNTTASLCWQHRLCKGRGREKKGKSWLADVGCCVSRAGFLVYQTGLIRIKCLKAFHMPADLNRFFGLMWRPNKPVMMQACAKMSPPDKQQQQQQKKRTRFMFLLMLFGGDLSAAAFPER